MKSLVNKLRKLAVHLEAQQGKIFVLNTKEDLTPLIEKCETMEDVLELARRWSDHLMSLKKSDNDYDNNDDDYDNDRYDGGDGVDPYYDRDLNIGHDGYFANENVECYAIHHPIVNKWDEDEPNEDVNRELITRYHLPNAYGDQNSDEEPDSSDEPIMTATDLLTSFLEEQCIRTKWATWADCFRTLGYEYPSIFEEFVFESPMDIIDIQGELGSIPGEEPQILSEEERINETVDYCERFYMGELSSIELLNLATSIMEYCDASKSDYAELEDYTDSEEDIKNEIDSLRELVIGSFNDLVTDSRVDNPELEELKLQFADVKTVEDYDYDTLMELWERIDELHSVEEDKIYNDDEEQIGTQTESRKRSRIEFDLVEQPIDEIRFEQRQTDFILDEPAMKLLIQEIGQDFGMDLNFTDDAYAAIQTSAEDYMIKVFNNANFSSINGGLTHIRPKHIDMAQRIDSPPFF